MLERHKRHSKPDKQNSKWLFKHFGVYVHSIMRTVIIINNTDAQLWQRDRAAG